MIYEVGRWEKIDVIGRNAGSVLRLKCPECGYIFDMSHYAAINNPRQVPSNCWQCGADMKVKYPRMKTTEELLQEMEGD